MQKRTNPLELKVDNAAQQQPTPAAASFAPIGQQKLAVKAVEPTAVEMPAERIELEVQPTVTEKPPVAKRTAVQAPALEIKADAPAASEVKAQPVPSRMEAMPTADGEVRWSRMTAVTAPKVAPVPDPEQIAVEEPVIEDEPLLETSNDTYGELEQQPAQDELITDDVLNEDELAVTDADAAETFDAENGISDEDEPLTVDDCMMAARFSLRGRVSRGMKIASISRDVCRLAQLMHPEKSLSAILEDALMTRIYLENPDAFDALAEMLEKKGGRIKC